MKRTASIALLLLALSHVTVGQRLNESITNVDSTLFRLTLVKDTVILTVYNSAKVSSVVIDNSHYTEQVQELTSMVSGKKKKVYVIAYRIYADPGFEMNVVSIKPGEKYQWKHFIPKKYRKRYAFQTQYFVLEEFRHPGFTEDELKQIITVFREKSDQGVMIYDDFYAASKFIGLGFMEF